MISATFFQFILLAIDNDGGDLLVHKNENDTEQCWEEGEKPPPKMVYKWTNHPTACIQCRFKLIRYIQFGRCNIYAVIQKGH